MFIRTLKSPRKGFSPGKPGNWMNFTMKSLRVELSRKTALFSEVSCIAPVLNKFTVNV